jgi:uncharacterized membrane protein YccC
VLVGCGVAFAFLLAFGNRTHWVLPLALATTVLISTNVVRVKTMWRQAPITAAVVLAAAITTAHATEAGFGQGLHKVAEVIFGCLVGVGVSWTTSKIWLLRPEPGGAEGA